jgi:hypothetical protein
LTGNHVIENRYHLTDWILYTSSNFLNGGYWTRHIFSSNFCLNEYFSNIIEIGDFYRFLFLDSFNIDSLGLNAPSSDPAT